MITENQIPRIAKRLADEIGMRDDVGDFVYNFARLPVSHDIDMALAELERSYDDVYKEAIHIVLQEVCFS